MLRTFPLTKTRLLRLNSSQIVLSKGCDETKILSEWIRLKLDLNERHKRLLNDEVWKVVLTSKMERYPNVGHIVRIILIFLVSTAHVDASFPA